MFLAFRERRFARRIIRQLLHSYSIIRAEDPALSGQSLYRAVLVHTRLLDTSNVDQALWEAEDSVDEWTTHANKVLGFRQVAHFVVMAQHRAAGHGGAVVSFRDIVYSLIPADL
jgi:hypothetical protein